MRALLATLLALGCLEAAACGICIEDKVAACYDHAVVSQAKARGHEVAFFAIDGPLVRSADNRARVAKAIHAQRGVLAGTARVSLENAALSFAYDPGRTSRAAVAGAVQERLAAGLSLRFLRAMP